MKTTIKIVFISFFLVNATAASATELRETLKLVLGDWSDDGHGKTQEFFLRSNLSKVEVAAAMTVATQRLGYDFAQEVASEYEDAALSKDKLQQLRDLGIEVLIDDEDDYDDQSFVELSTAAYTRIWLALVKLGDPRFQYEIIEADAWLPIGGYGLFF